MTAAIQCPKNRITLRFGANSPSVREMQKALNLRLVQMDTITKHPLRIVVSGYFDKETQNAVKYLQGLAFLPIDGIVGLETWAYICEGAASLPTLSLGCSGLSVKSVQQALKDSGFYIGTVDGIFGLKTIQAVRDFQIDHRLIADGIIGELTWNALSHLESHAIRCSTNAFTYFGSVKYLAI
jgi:peptidoglycan hydrolase-like protein with peptidoglycan-binding domain